MDKVAEAIAAPVSDHKCLPEMSQDTCLWLDILRESQRLNLIRAIDLAVGYQWLTRLYRHPEGRQNNMLASAAVADNHLDTVAEHYRTTGGLTEAHDCQRLVHQLQYLQQTHLAAGHPLSSPTLLLLAGVSTSIALGRGQVCCDLALPPLPQWKGIWPAHWHGLNDIHHAGLIKRVGLGRLADIKQIGQAQGVWVADIAASDDIKTHSIDLSVNDNPTSINRFYFARYYVYEQALAGHLIRLSSANLLDNRGIPGSEIVDWPRLNEMLGLLFPSSPWQQGAGNQPEQQQSWDWQKIAAATACINSLSIITGGPGTGKTTTVTKILLALATLFSETRSDSSNRIDKNFRIALIAPTGKAAARLIESVQSSVSQLKQQLPPTEDLFSIHWPWHLIPTEATTIHRLLGVKQGAFIFNEQRQLSYDCVVIDEASMIDLPLMERLLRSIRTGARVIMLGDEDQLASVEAGSVLADMVAQRHQLDSSKALVADQSFLSAVMNQSLTPEKLPSASFQRGLAHLYHSYRFAGDGGIGQLASTINQGAGEDSWQLLHNHQDLTCYPYRENNGKPVLPNSVDWLSQALEGYADYWAASQVFSGIPINELAQPEHQDSIKQLFQLFSNYQILTAVRDGLSGVAHINAVLEKALRTTQPQNYGTVRAVQYAPIKEPVNQDQAGLWYCGRPIMINRNDHRLGLYNGDIGITLGQKQQYRVAFIDSQGDVRLLLPSRLPAHETAFAFTVHKSQGSEFATSHCILPQQWLPVITRELLYTAVTRARKAFWLTTSESTWKRAVATQVQRASGLAELL